MATTLKVLGQSSPAATTDTAAYTVPAATSTVVSSITVCNANATPVTYRIYIRIAAAAAANTNALAYDISLAGNATDVYTLGATLATTDVISVRASATLVTFTIFGQENT